MQIKATQDVFLEEEVARLVSIPIEEVRSLAQTRRLGSLPSDSAGGERVYSASDLAIISFLYSRSSLYSRKLDSQ